MSAADSPSNRAGILRGITGFASRGVVQLLLLGVTLVATRSLSITDFGSYAIGSLFQVLARQLFYIGPYEYLLKTPGDDGLLPAAFTANLVQACGVALAMGAVWLAAPLLFSAPAVAQVLGMLVPSVFLVAVTAWYEAVLLRQVRVRRYYASTLAADTTGAIMAVVLLVHGYGVAALVWQTYSRLLVLLALYPPTTRVRPALSRDAGRVAQVLRWSVARYAAVLLNFTTAYGADLVLGTALSPAATGLYRAANRIVTAMTDLFAQPLQKIAQTNLSATYVRNGDMSTSWLRMLAGVGAIAWSGLVTLAFMADELVPYVIGERWRSAVPIVIVFCATKSFSLLDAVTTSFLICHDRQRDMFKIQLASAVAVIVLGFASAPLGPVAVALTVGLATTGMSLAYGRMVIRISAPGGTALREVATTAAPPVLAVSAGLGLLHLLAPQLHGLSAVVAGGGVAAAAFLIGAMLVRQRILDAIGTLGHRATGRPIEAT